jgi:predicted transcriptional regulator of viral defense system
MGSGRGDGGVKRYVEDLQRSRVYTLTREELVAKSGASATAVASAVTRLKKHKRLTEPRRGFLVLLPLEYQDSGHLPPTWWLDDLMRFLAQPYYVGILSAAAIHGAAEQSAGAFHVITDRSSRSIVAGRTRIDFFMKDAVDRAGTQNVRTETGSMVVSNPEETAFDLVRYARASENLGDIARVLAGLGAQLDADKLVDRAAHFELTVSQRLGYLLDLTGHRHVTKPLQAWVTNRNPVRAPLDWTDRPFAGPVDRRWTVVVNRTVEAQG